MRFTPEQLAFADAVHAFCAKECDTLAQRDAITDGGRLSNSPALLAKLSALGWLGISFPESYGGAGASFVDECLAVNDLFLTGVRLPADAVVGEVGHAWKQLMRGLNVERLIIAAMSLGAAQRSLDDLLGYVTVREQFGRTIGGWRSGTASPTSPRAHHRSFVYDVADRFDAGEEDHLDREGAMAKLKVTESSRDTPPWMRREMMGGYGYARECGMEGQVRRTLAPPIYGGANEIQRGMQGAGL